MVAEFGLALGWYFWLTHDLYYRGGGRFGNEIAGYTFGIGYNLGSPSQEFTVNRLPHIVVLFFLCFAGCESKPAVKQNTVTESKTAVALVAVDKKRENARPEQKPDAGLQKIITDVANDSKINGSSMKKVEAWLDKNLKKGVTTRNDFVQRFGKMNLVDLDRPPRDNVITLVWFIYNDGPPKQLGVNHYGIVFWFDAKTGKFLRRYQKTIP